MNPVSYCLSIETSLDVGVLLHGLESLRENTYICSRYYSVIKRGIRAPKQ